MVDLLAARTKPRFTARIRLSTSSEENLIMAFNFIDLGGVVNGGMAKATRPHLTAR
jgi:hypothetical protein